MLNPLLSPQQCPVVIPVVCPPDSLRAIPVCSRLGSRLLCPRLDLPRSHLVDLQCSQATDPLCNPLVGLRDNQLPDRLCSHQWDPLHSQRHCRLYSPVCSQVDNPVLFLASSPVVVLPLSPQFSPPVSLPQDLLLDLLVNPVCSLLYNHRINHQLFPLLNHLSTLRRNRLVALAVSHPLFLVNSPLDILHGSLLGIPLLSPLFDQVSSQVRSRLLSLVFSLRHSPLVIRLLNLQEDLPVNPLASLAANHLVCLRYSRL